MFKRQAPLVKRAIFTSDQIDGTLELNACGLLASALAVVEREADAG